MSLERLIKAFRHPLRLALTVVIALALVSGVATGGALLATLLGVVLGQPVGELLGRSRIRLPLGLGVLLLAGVLAWMLGTALASFSLVPGWLGAPATLQARAFLQFGAVFFTGTAALRALAARRPAWQVVELAVLAMAFATAFSAHREGAVVRPLWLSDWAFRAGYDPAQILLLIGGTLGVLLLFLLLLESRHRLSIVSAVALPVLAAVAISLIDTQDLSPEPQASELAEIKEAMGEPPIHRPPDSGQRGTAGGDPRDPGVEPQQGEGAGSQPRPAPGAEPPEPGESGGTPRGQPDGASQPQDQPGQPGEQPESQPPKETKPEDQGTSAPDPKQLPVAVVILGDDYHPPSEGFYLRQEAHSQFNGTRLVPTTRNDVDLDLPSGFPVLPEAVRDPPPAPSRQLVHAHVAMVAEHTAPFALEGPTTFAPMVNPNPLRFRMAYRFESLGQAVPYDELLGTPAGHPGWSDEVRAYYTDFPDGDPRYLQLAQKIVATLPEPRRDDPFARALAVKLYLDENTRYSTKERHAGVEDPTADYLFGNFVGYCVHTAHAAAYLWRALSIPARVGTGYLVFEEDRRGSTLAVRAGDAHAWPELYLEGVGWVVLDIAPSENLDPVGPPIDDEMVKMLSEMAREVPRQEAAKPRDLSLVRRALAYTFLGALGLALVLLVSGHWVVKGWRVARVGFAGTRQLPRVAYRTALDRLAEIGWSRGYGETREDFALRVAVLSPAFLQATQLHLDARMGDPSRSPSGHAAYDRQHWRDLLRRIRVDLHHTTPWWRRLLGLLNPFSFYRAR